MANAIKKLLDTLDDNSEKKISRTPINNDTKEILLHLART